LYWNFRNTRLAKLDAPDGPYAALILAKAGLVRLGLGHRCTADLNAPILYHAVSQGALAIEIRSDDAEAKKLCEALTHWETQWKCYAERACLRVLEGGCSVPVGVVSALKAKAEGPRGGVLKLTGCVTSLDGGRHVEHTVEKEVQSLEEAEEVGAGLARVLMGTGAQAILDEITKDRERRAGEDKSEAEVEAIENTMQGAKRTQA
jgi:hydroxymethylbilane synthase